MIKAFLELFLGCFILYVFVMEDQNQMRQTEAKTMPFSVRLVKAQGTKKYTQKKKKTKKKKKSTGLEK